MDKKFSLENRMKNYERAAKTYLTRRTPVIIRIDGRAFHTFTKNLEKPFDPMVTLSMEGTLVYLCQNIQNCVFGYAQSDEISLLLVDYTNPDTDAWYDNQVQKLASISASMATMMFNKKFHTSVELYRRGFEVDGLATFDVRAFNLPKEEVNNYFIWRQRDCIRNSIQTVGHAYYTHAELHGKNTKEICDMLASHGLDWEGNFPIINRFGSCCRKIPIGWSLGVEENFAACPEFINDLLHPIQTHHQAVSPV